MNATWKSYQKGFLAWLRLERRLSENTIEAYSRDVARLGAFAGDTSSPTRISTEEVRAFLHALAGEGISARSQARILSSLKSFFRYLEGEESAFTNPVELMDGPRLGRYLPEVLSPEEVDRIIAAIDRSKSTGERNKAIVELLFSCGIRVSELTALRFSDLFLKHGVIRVTGKGDKERLVPIGKSAIKQLELYIMQVRRLQNTDKHADDLVFINSRGGRLSRQMIYIIVRDLAEAAGIDKKIGPHTFRHSFATALVNRDAGLRAVQEMLGHESITTTEIYTHLSRKKLDDTMTDHHPRSKKKRG